MKKLNICFDGRILYKCLDCNAIRTGIYWVAANLLKHMINNKNVEITLFLDDVHLNTLPKLFKSLGINPLRVYCKDSDFSEFDAFFSPIYFIPDCIRKYPNVSCYTVVHDIIPLLFPDYYALANTTWFKDLINSLNSVDYYFPNSEHTKKDFSKYIPQITPENMQAIPLATNLEYKPNKDAQQVENIRKKYNIPEGKKYLFSLCSLEPRKNLIRAVKNFVKFIEKNNIDDIIYVLGGQAWAGFIEKFKEEVPDYEKYEDKIIRAGYIDDEDLEVLYSNAEWFVYTSQYEGFGMPPLEAMACACPVITSNNSSLPEVVGDAGIMIDYDSDEQHIEAYEKYYFDNNFRQEMAQKGLERSKLFSWDKAVEIILNKMYEVEAKKAQQPLVTIITPSFNLLKDGRKEWFIQNLESVRNQTYPNIEHIVIDGASTDGTIELLKEYQDKGWIKYYSEPDKGIYDALNKGIIKANGKYVVCLNSDDYYCNTRAVEYEVSKLEENNADACYANAIRVKPDTLEKMSDWNGEDYFIPFIDCFPCHQTFMIKTEVMKELGLYKTKYRVSADNEFFQKLLRFNKKFVSIDVDIISFRDGGFSNSNVELGIKEQKENIFNHYGISRHLTPYDVENLFGYKFHCLPLDEAIHLGAKLISINNQDCIKHYFTQLINHHLEAQKQALIEQFNAEKHITIKDAIKVILENIFSVKNSKDKKHKIVTIFGIKIKVKRKF